MTDLPCPFCGNTDQLIDSITDADVIGSPERWFLCCETCGATGPVVTREGEQDDEMLAAMAETAWNQRETAP